VMKFKKKLLIFRLLYATNDTYKDVDRMCDGSEGLGVGLRMAQCVFVAAKVNYIFQNIIFIFQML
jgi:hypothetical protein